MAFNTAYYSVHSVGMKQKNTNIQIYRARDRLVLIGTALPRVVYLHSSEYLFWFVNVSALVSVTYFQCYLCVYIQLKGIQVGSRKGAGKS